MSRKKITIAVVSVIAVVLVAIAVTVIVALSRGDITVSSGTFTQSSANFENGVWSEKKEKLTGAAESIIPLALTNLLIYAWKAQTVPEK